MVRVIFRAVLLALGLGGVSQAETLSGSARLLDGDTIAIGGQVVRLHGIDAPETGQTCYDAREKPYRCGVAALDRLRALIAGRTVTCVGAERDRYDRLIATCRSGSRDLNRTMVAEGYAVAFRRYSDDYLSEELDAFKAGRGIWQGRFERPYEERRKRWAAAEKRSPGGCPIKGNVSSRGRIYHTPYSQYYDRARINTARGERWFCSEAEAIAAGWRAPFR